MDLLPAIDLMDGQVVRLAEGRRDAVTVYEQDPARMVRRFADDGARWIHVVDLDGAFAGAPTQTGLIESLVNAAHERGLQIQVGGGVRTRADIERLLTLGVDRVVVGTLAAKEPGLVEEICRANPGRLTIAIDARDGMVAVSGWTEITQISASDLAKHAAAWGAGALLFTDVSRDGLEVGANADATAALQSLVEIPVIASGGVGTLAHLRELRDLNIRAAVVGRALYEGNFTLQEALSC
jgi:phosphoribosylformimino-5-aminoimidazole carboxamide ribotide isomerase